MRRNQSDAEAARRAELASFLRARRASLQPATVNLCPPPGRRNTPGLRREEVAQISGVGVTWYTWLEQGRPMTITSHVIDALALAFRLDHDSHRHLRQLAGLPVPEPDQMPEPAAAELAGLLDVMSPAPACILGPRFDFVAWNNEFGVLWRPETLPALRRNVLWLVFCDPYAHQLMPGWRDRGRILLGEFRAANGHHAGDKLFAELTAALNEASPEFRKWWPTYYVAESITGPITINHATLGQIRLNVNELRLCAHPSLTLSVQAPQRPTDRSRLEQLRGLRLAK